MQSPPSSSFLGISTAETLRRAFINFVDGDTSKLTGITPNSCRQVTAEICCAKLFAFAFFPPLFAALRSPLFRWCDLKAPRRWLNSLWPLAANVAGAHFPVRLSPQIKWESLCFNFKFFCGRRSVADVVNYRFYRSICLCYRSDSNAFVMLLFISFGFRQQHFNYFVFITHQCVLLIWIYIVDTDFKSTKK